uniref:Uncharacterized protein n=1 Tax=Anguilla anguilla TaxID=7936 RepID=A0A0E9RL45_ANGAN
MLTQIPDSVNERTVITIKYRYL